jgi:hypothetical protein
VTAETAPLGVVVLGMHRSGTSAVTRLVSLLGPCTPVDDDLVPPSAKNPKGYWESMSLVNFNERLLRALGSDMRAPLRLEPGWEDDARLGDLRVEAPAAFRRTFPADPWVWKDPRMCLTFSFWQATLGVRPPIVLVHRNPLEIVASTLRAGRDEAKVDVLALWERYLRQALRQIDGLPVLVTSYDAVLSDPLGWCDEALAFLRAAGVPVAPPAREEVRAFVDEGLRHVRSTRKEVLDDPEVSDAQRDFFVVLEEAQGLHWSFVLPDLPPETATTEPLLAERRRLLRLEWERARSLPAPRAWTRARRFVSRGRGS